MSFFDRLETRCREVNSVLCVGLDPHESDLGSPTAEAAFEFCCTLIDATKHVACAYKPNAAFFEALGGDGFEALRKTVSYIPDGIPVLLDAKRGDISTTAAAYAQSAFEYVGADAITLSPYMGRDSVEPFAGDAARGVFLLCKTSNPSADEVQRLRIRDGTESGLAAAAGAASESPFLFERVASLASTWSAHPNVGLVVGATDLDALARVRRAAPSLWILAPGVGAQGAEPEPVAAAAVRPDGLGLLVPVSRAISRAPSPKAAAEELAARLRTAIAAATTTPAAAAAGAAGAPPEIAPYQRKFIDFALSLGVLRFGSFTLKSGRASPYFFNAGLFSSGGALRRLAHFYAQALRASPLWGSFDVLFGPAYKGIPLVTAVGMALDAEFGADVPVCYNRKEAKDHGEGGTLVGASMEGKRVLVVDDVITAGTAVAEAMALVQAAGGSGVGVLIALDREEVGGGAEPPADGEPRESAVQRVRREHGLHVVPVVGMQHLLAFLSERQDGSDALREALDSVAAYRAKYGVLSEASAAEA